MRVSELAKQLGYRAAELVELAKDRGLPIETARDNVDARAAAAVRAQIPPRSKLEGQLKELYEKIKKDLAERPKEKKLAAPRVRKPRKPAAPKPPKDEKAPEAAKPAEAPAGAAPARPAAPKKPKTVRKKKVVEEFRLGEAGAKTETPKAPVKKRVKVFTEEELREMRREKASNPLIDVDKVIGEEKDVRVVRSSEIDQYERAKKDEKRSRGTPERATAKIQDRGRPHRRVKGPPIARPTVSLPTQRPVIIPPSEREYTIQVPITLKDFSQAVGLKANAIISKMMSGGQMCGMVSVLDGETVEYLSAEFKRKVTVVREKKIEDVVAEEAEQEKGDPKDIAPRSPVVTFLGHVDHGKTSLLDKIRDTDVAAGEAGGITQHIGASKVRTRDGREVVFLDTPGHEAFTAMRARGAKATDLVVLVVAADDGVMPQTEEAYNHAKAAKVPVMVALNKVDKKEANINKVKGQLASLGLQTEDWGGSTSAVEVSALTGHNIDTLIETIALEAEMLELKANPKLRGRGVVLEAVKTGDRGVVTTLLVQDGTLRQGDILLSGRACGRVRSMHDDRGRPIREAGPSTPVEVSGLDEVPDVGERFQVVPDLRQAKAVVEERRAKEREAARLEQAKHVTLESLFSKIEQGSKEVKVVVKADTFGSQEVLVDALQNLSNDEVRLTVLHAAVGGIAESDVILADASDAIVVGFGVEPDERASVLAKDKGVDIRHYRIIYEAIEEMKAALEGLLEPDRVPVTIGHLAVKEIFRKSGVGAIAGCLVTDGKVERGAQVRLIRNGKVVHEGKIDSLRRFRDDVREVAEGYECGLKIAGHDNVLSGDVIEVFTIQEVARKLEKKKS